MVSMRGGGTGQEYNAKGHTQKHDLNVKYGKQGKTLGGDIGRGVSQANNAIGNWGVGLLGGAGDALSYLTGNKSLSHLGKDAQTNNNIYRHEQSKNPKPAPAAPVDEGSQFIPTPQDSWHGTVVQPGDQAQPQSFTDMLKAAMEMSNSMSGGGVDFSAQRADLQNRAADGDRRIADMYKQLQGEYASQAAPMQATYDKSASTIQDSSNAASANVDAANNAAQSQQSAQMQALGIGDVSGVLASQGGEASRDASIAKQNIEQNRVANAGANTSNAQSAGKFNTQIGQAAGLQGATSRGQLQGQLQSRLAALGVQEQQANQQKASNSLSQALGLVSGMQGDQGRALEQTRYNQTRADQAQARQDGLDANAAKMQQDAYMFDTKMTADQTSQQSRAAVPAQVQAVIASLGVKPGDPQYAQLLAAIAAMQNRAAN